MKIINEGSKKKFVNKIDHITFSSIEIAPGVDLDKDVLAQMEYMPNIADALKLMDARIFRDESIGQNKKAKEKKDGIYLFKRAADGQKDDKGIRRNRSSTNSGRM